MAATTRPHAESLRPAQRSGTAGPPRLRVDPTRVSEVSGARAGRGWRLGCGDGCQGVGQGVGASGCQRDGVMGCRGALPPAPCERGAHLEAAGALGGSAGLCPRPGGPSRKACCPQEGGRGTPAGGTTPGQAAGQRLGRVRSSLGAGLRSRRVGRSRLYHDDGRSWAAEGDSQPEAIIIPRGCHVGHRPLPSPPPPLQLGIPGFWSSACRLSVFLFLSFFSL